MWPYPFIPNHLQASGWELARIMQEPESDVEKGLGKWTKSVTNEGGQAEVGADRLAGS